MCRCVASKGAPVDAAVIHDSSGSGRKMTGSAQQYILALRRISGKALADGGFPRSTITDTKRKQRVKGANQVLFKGRERFSRPSCCWHRIKIGSSL